MESFLNALQNFDYSKILGDLPIVKIALVFLILVLTQFCRKLISNIIIGFIQRLTARTETTLDDELLAIIKPALNLVILVFGLWLAQAVLAEEIGPQLSKNIDKITNFITVVIIGYVLFRAASLLGRGLANSILKTDTELDDLLGPFIPKIFQAIAVMVVIIKASEIFLGASAGALAGLLGGAGLTIGLLFKDVVYDWFCTVIIYTDYLYKEGDWLVISEFKNMVQVLNIGFRTTTVHDTTMGCIFKMPNSKMISGIVANWSQNAGEQTRWGINLHLQIDGISAQQTSKICDEIAAIPPSIPGCYSKCLVRFKKIEQNARVIEIRAYVNDVSLYFAAERKLNLGILELLERENIDSLYIKLETDPEQNKRHQQSANN